MIYIYILLVVIITKSEYNNTNNVTGQNKLKDLVQSSEWR